MNQFGELYAKYYDLLYKDKDYNSEVEYVNKLIQQSNPNAKTILELGCGTGKHAELFCEKNYSVHGVDLSLDMLNIAKKRAKKSISNLEFTHSSIQELDLNKQFDSVISLFHVMSYQNSNSELIKAFEVAKKHLKKDGVYIFDFWYGPAVLTDLPVVRVKRLENKDIEVTRVAEPKLKTQDNVVDVNYDIFIKNKKTNSIIEKKELHKMRYFFDKELELICENIGFKILKKSEWLSEKIPDFNSWNVVWILKNDKYV